MTIHKCQGLSLDSAIIDLSDKIFDDDMAYVTLSRLRTLSGVHLVDFNPKSVEMVSIPSLKELNRLRNLYRQDLPQYVIPDIESLLNASLQVLLTLIMNLHPRDPTMYCHSLVHSLEDQLVLLIKVAQII